MTHRDPKGKFISQDAMLSAWLPWMLQWIWRDALVQMLTIGIKHCERECSNHHRLASEQILTLGDAVMSHEYHSTYADAWMQRRDVLLRAVKELEAIK